jgi:hypothetical protein
VGWFRRLVRLLLFRTIHDVVLMMDRERAGREAGPSAAVKATATCAAVTTPSAATAEARWRGTADF